MNILVDEVQHPVPLRGLSTGHYPVDSVPEFWEWIAHQAAAEALKMPLEMYEEIKDGGTNDEKDLLFAWITNDDIKIALLLHEDVDPTHVDNCTSTGYAPDLTDDRRYRAKGTRKHRAVDRLAALETGDEEPCPCCGGRMRAEASPHACPSTDQDRHLMTPSPPIQDRSDNRHSCWFSAGSVKARSGLLDSPVVAPILSFNAPT